MAYQKKENPTTVKGGCKSVDRDVFIEQLGWATSFGLNMKTGKPYRDKMIEAAKKCGLSEPTFILRANQFVSPEIYGELPKGFFKKNEKGRSKQETE